jgi:serine/threonine protein phosphatase PrpC
VDVTGDVMTQCEACQAALLPDDRFCEACGARAGAEGEEVAETPVGCHACGAPPEAFDIDGYCALCGVLRRAPGEHHETDLAFAAAVTDQGKVHRRNEDAFHLERVGERGVAVVVCDGISNSLSGDVAARSASAAAGAVLVDALDQNAAELADRVAAAVLAARRAVERVPWTARADLPVPSCTLVCAVCRKDELVIGSVGDSRAYWIAQDEVRQLTVDDSWATDQVAEGLLSPEQAESDPRAHGVTRWIGTDAPDDPPQVVRLAPAAPGRLLLCSDGLWNYLSAPGELVKLIEDLPGSASPVAVARSLVEVALDRGGRDNITVAVIDVQPDRRSP